MRDAHPGYAKRDPANVEARCFVGECDPPPPPPGPPAYTVCQLCLSLYHVTLPKLLSSAPHPRPSAEDSPRLALSMSMANSCLATPASSATYRP